MKNFRILATFLLVCLSAPLTRAGGDRVSTHFTPDPRNDSDAPSFEMSTETAYMLGVIGNPNSYEIGAQFITARWRFGPVYREGFLRGYNQFYSLGMVEPIFRGPENFYYGISVGLRYNFLHPESRWTPYVSGGVGLGWIDSHSNVFGAQGQDFTFNCLGAFGVSYKINDHWQATAGAVYQHLSNGGQTDPNPSLNLLGPQIGVTYSY
jgi:opacity protein-like surface antigen